MGTGFERDVSEGLEGIIPRAVRHLFSSINNLKENPYDENGICMDMLQFSVGAQFLELYNEDIIDLLDPYNKVSDICCMLLQIGPLNCLGERLIGLFAESVSHLLPTSTVWRPHETSFYFEMKQKEKKILKSRLYYFSDKIV